MKQVTKRLWAVVLAVILALTPFFGAGIVTYAEEIAQETQTVLTEEGEEAVVEEEAEEEFPEEVTLVTEDSVEFEAANDVVLADGTYKATKVTTDVTTEASGMIMVTDATVVIKDGKAEAVVTMKGTGADRLYVSETATKDTIITEAVAEEQKEVGGEFGNLIGGLKLGENSAYSFWPIEITLGEPKVYAARSASHFAKQDKLPEEYYYVHDFQIDAGDLELLSESTDLPISAEEEAQKYLNQYFLDGKISTSATATDIKGKGANVTVPYYKADESKLSSFIFKMAESDKFRSGWFIDSSILNTTYFTSSNLKKIRYPEGASGKVTFNPKATYRDQGMTFTATLKLYPADASYNQYDAEGVYYDKEPLATQEFAITVSPIPEDRHVTIKVLDAVSGEEINGAVVTVTKDSDGSVVAPADGAYTMSVPGTYTVKASAEGYLVPGSEETELVQTEYAPKKDGETLELKLIKAEESKRTISFAVKDQLGDEVTEPAISVYPWADKEAVVAPEEDGSFKLYTGTLYGYTITKEGYEEKTKTMKPENDDTVEVLVNKYLSEQRFTFRVYDNKTNETLEGVELVVKYGPSGEDESTYQEAQPDENGVYTIPIDNRVIAYGSKTGYKDDSLGVWSLGFDPQKDCSFGLKPLSAEDMEKIIEDLPAAEELTLEDKEAVEQARAEYEALSEEAKEAVAPETLNALKTAEAMIEKLEAEKEAEEAQTAIDELAEQLKEVTEQLEAVKEQLAKTPGWHKNDDGSWYFCDNKGETVKGWLSDGGKWYFMNKETGIMQTGWVKDGSTWYYMSGSGAMVTGWQKVGDTWYFFKSSGAMAANERCEGYWLNANGSWTYQPKGSWKKNNQGWWFGDTSGWYAKNTTQKIDNVNYKFNAAGYWVQ